VELLDQTDSLAEDPDLVLSLDELLTRQICPGTGMAPEAVWAALEKIVDELGPKIRALLARRDALPAASSAKAASLPRR
jgi:malate synthase